MATTLIVGDIAIVHYDTSTDAFSFVFLRDVEAGTTVNFTDNGWLAAGGFRPGENTITYTASSAITAGTVVTLTGLDLDAAGDQIIAYQGDAATPTILHLVDLGDGNNTVAGDATNDNTTALPPGFTLGVNAVALPFDDAIYAGPTNGSPGGLFTALNNPANWLGGDSLPVAFTFNAKPIIDLDADNSTHLNDDYETVVSSGGPAVPVADLDLDIDDPDGGDIFAAEFRIIGFDVRDLLTVNGALPPGIVATTYRVADGTIRLEGRASHEDYETAIRQVVFSTDDTPGDQKRIKISVFDGESWSKDATAFVDVLGSLIAAPPGLDLDANNSTGGGADATATFTSGGPAISVTDTDVSITADAATIASATITILGWSRLSGDALIAGALPPGITASPYNPLTGVMTLSGEASLADYQAALRAVAFDTTSTSTADRGIQITVTDGAGLISNLATMYMHVVIPPPNIAPVLDLDANNSTTTGTSYLTGFTESVPVVPVPIVDNDLLLIDGDDANLVSATITLTNPQAGDVLIHVGTPPPGITVSGSGSSVITLTGIVASGSYQTALEQIRFSNDSPDPSNVTRTIEIVVSDGTSNSNTATALVQVEAVNNSAPAVDLDPNDSSFGTRTTFRTVFTENGPSIAIADTDTSITDLDSTALVSATITLANQQFGDFLTVLAALPAGIVASAFDPLTGVLTLTGTATLDDYEVALQRVLYGHNGEDPATEDRLIEVVVSDGVNTSNVAAAVISVVPVNDAPDVILEGTVYIENATVIALDPDAALSDPDDAELSQVVIRITSGVIPGDGDTLTVGGLTSGIVDGISFFWDATEHALLLIGASSVLNYQNLLRTVGFDSSSDNPTDYGAEAVRILTWAISDGTAVTTTTTTLDIVAVNDAPQATIAATASYTENAAPLVLSPASTVTDVDNVVLVSGEIRIVSGAQDGDLLTVNGLQSGTFAGIEFSYEPLLYSLTFTHPTLIADYEAFLEAVAFSSTSDDPTNSGLNPTRTLSWFVFDGDALSNLQTTVVTITALADAPVNTVPAAQSVNEDTPLAIAGVSVADLDSSTLTTTLTVTSGTLNVTAGAGVSNNGTAAVTITGTAAEINTALAGLSYLGNLNFNGPDTLTVSTNDGATPPDIDTIAITVNPVNDAPLNTVPAAQSVNEDTLLPIAGVSVADVDGGTLTTTLTVTSGTLNVTAGAGVTGNGTAAVTITGTAAQINAALAGLSYLGNLNFNGPDTLTVTTGDDIAQDIDTVAITVNPVADPPANTVPGPQSVNEDVTLAIAGVSVADPDVGSLTTTLTVTNGTLNVTAGAGVTGNGTAAVTITGTATRINTALAGLSYRGNLNFNGPDTLTVTTGDGTAQDIDTVAITVNAVGDPPVNTVPAALSVNEDTPLPIAGVSVADADVGPLTTTLTVTGGTLTVTAGAGVSGNGTAAVTISGTAAQINAALAGLSYLGNLNFNGSETLTVTTGDGTAQDIDTVAITVNPLNDPPVNTVPAAQSVNEDGVRSIAGVSVADVDGGTLTTTLTVTSGTLNVTAGAGVTGNGTAAVTITGTAAQINTALTGLNYRGNLNFNGPDTLTVTTGDGTAQDIDTVAITVNPVNDPPQLSPPKIVRVNEDTTLLIPGMSVSDVDSLSLTTVLEVTDGIINVTAGTGATVGGNGTAAITITGTVSQTNAALAGLSYRGNLNFNGQDNLVFRSSDEAFTRSTPNLIIVDPVNDAPANTVPAAQSVSEDTVLPIGGVSVADVDGGPLTTTLTAASGTLSVTAGAGVSGNGTAAVTIMGTVAEINFALGSLAYTGTLDFNGSDTVTVSTSDGALGDIDTIEITVNAENDAPVNTVPGAHSVNEDTNGSIAGLAVADVDAGAAALTATLSVAHGTLTIAAAGGAAVSGSGTGTVTLTGTASQINTTLAAANNVVYRGLQHYFGPDTLTLTTDDGGNTGAGGVLTDTDTVAITVNAVNDRPVLDLDADNSSGAAGTGYTTTFTEGGAAATVADLDDLITDIDNANLTSATITLANPFPADLLSVVGTLPVGITASAYDPSTGVLTLSGAATLGAYQAALRQITFSNSSPVPSATDRIVNILVNDGAASSVAAHAFIHVLPVDTAPALDLDGDDSSGATGADYTAVFAADGAAIPIADTDTLLADVDSTQVTSATITVTNGEATDLLVVNGTLPPGITASSFDPVTGILTLSGSASLAAYQAALHQIAFDSSVSNPLTATRVIEVVVNDGTSDSSVASSLIQISVAAPPTLDLDADDSTASGSDYATTFTEDGAAVRIADTDIAISTSALASATITLTNLLPGDVLSVSGTLPPGITHVYDPGTGVMTLTGEASAAAYQAASDQIVYSNTSDNPATDNRIITVVVNDGVNDSNTATAIVELAAVNDPPALSVATAASYTENAAATLVSPVVAISDPDSPNLTIGIATITDGLNPGDVLTVGGLRSGNLGPVIFNWAPSLNELIVTGSGSPEDYEALFQSVRFFSDSDDPTNGGADTTRTISWAVFDGTSTVVSTTTLTITALNDAPVAQSGSASGTEDTPITGTLVATDVDSPSLTYSLGTQATNGTVVVNPDGSFTYTPVQDFFGTDSFTFVANDAEADSNIATVNLTIAAVNDAPLLDLDADDSTVPSTHFATVFSGAAVPISDLDVAITDPDSATLASATIHILVPSSGDLLSVNGLLPAGISASAYDPVTGILTLSGEASIAGYQTAIHQVEFGTTDTSLTSRIIEITVNDGTLDSNAAVTVIDFSPPPEPPPVTVDPHWMATREFAPHPAGWSPIIVADFAGDQMSDLLWRSDSTGNLDEWQIVNGDWTRSVDLGGHPDAGFLPAAAGDFNGDGTDDIFWFEPASGNTDIWQMANGGWAASISPGLHPTGFEVAGTGDFDGDGTDDVLWFSTQTGEVDIWKIVNGQWAGSVNPGASPAGFAIAATGDTNHDGSDDVIWFNASSGDVQIWEMQNGQLAQTVDVGPHPSGYSIVGSADFTGDGTDDILWFNPATNHVDLWKIEDSHWAGSVDIGLHPPGWQPIGIGDSDGNGIADVWWQQGATSTVETWLLSVD